MHVLGFTMLWFYGLALFKKSWNLEQYEVLVNKSRTYQKKKKTILISSFYIYKNELILCMHLCSWSNTILCMAQVIR